MNDFAGMVRAELGRARAKFVATDLGYRHGKPHYFYAVILEELDELWDLVKADAVEKRPGGKEEMLKELVQIAAMAQRAAEDMGLVGHRKEAP